MSSFYSMPGAKAVSGRLRLDWGSGLTYSWNHFPNSELGKMHDDLLRAELGLPEVSFVFQYISH